MADLTEKRELSLNALANLITTYSYLPREDAKELADKILKAGFKRAILPEFKPVDAPVTPAKKRMPPGMRKRRGNAADQAPAGSGGVKHDIGGWKNIDPAKADAASRRLFIDQQLPRIMDARLLHSSSIIPHLKKVDPEWEESIKYDPRRAWGNVWFEINLMEQSNIENTLQAEIHIGSDGVVMMNGYLWRPKQGYGIRRPASTDSVITGNAQFGNVVKMDVEAIYEGAKDYYEVRDRIEHWAEAEIAYVVARVADHDINYRPMGANGYVFPGWPDDHYPTPSSPYGTKGVYPRNVKGQVKNNFGVHHTGIDVSPGKSGLSYPIHSWPGNAGNAGSVPTVLTGKGMVINCNPPASPYARGGIMIPPPGTVVKKGDVIGKVTSTPNPAKPTFEDWVQAMNKGDAREAQARSREELEARAKDLEVALEEKQKAEELKKSREAKPNRVNSVTVTTSDMADAFHVDEALVQNQMQMRNAWERMQNVMRNTRGNRNWL